MEIAGLEEADAAALAQIAKQVEFLVGEEAGVVSWNAFRSSTNCRSPLLSGDGADLDDVLVQVQQRLVQVPARTRSPSCRGTPTALRFRASISVFSSFSFATISSCDCSIRMR